MIDEITEREALVPDGFRSGQWTKLKRESVTPAFISHVRALLGGQPSRPAAQATAKENTDRQALGVGVAGTGNSAVPLPTSRAALPTRRRFRRFAGAVPK